MKKKFVLQIKKNIKKIIEYRIEEDEKVYQLKKTKLCVRVSLQKRFEKKWKYLEVQPNKIVFDNYMGHGYGCNCKYVTEELLKEPGRYSIVWTVKNAKENRKHFPEGIQVVEYLSKEAFEAYATAGFWISNYHMIAYLNRGLQKKKNQIYIQLWHGSFGIKKIEGDCQLLIRDNNWTYFAKKNAILTDYWISNSNFESNVYRQAFWGAGTILKLGHPRNDIFFKKQNEIRRSVRKRLGINEEKKIVMYVPTFRDEKLEKMEKLDMRRLCDVCQRRFGGSWVYVQRLHPRMQAAKIEKKEFGIDATDYPDIQELLVAADIVITDYSSCIFDFLLTGRPGFLYAPDYRNYEKMRGLYYPLDKTPFSIAIEQRELEQNILEFDEEEYKKNVQAFLREKGSCEFGKASQCLKIIIDEKIRSVS